MNTTRNEKFLEHSNRSICWNERGQIAIFVIIAIVIVAFILIFFLLVPALQDVGIIPGKDIDPRGFLIECIEPEIEVAVATLAKQGGSMNPEGFVLYKDEKINYLCYTAENFKTCIVQVPFILNHFREELETNLTPVTEDCFNKLKDSYRNAGYSLTSQKPKTNVSIEPGKIKVDVVTPITIVRGEESRTFTGFDLSFESEMYDILSISGNIVEFEAFYGDSDINSYIAYYPDLKIEKIRRDEGTSIYIVTDVISEESFTFASRSLVWPPGYN